MSTQVELKNWVRQEKEKSGLTNREIAKKAGIAHSSVSRAMHPDEIIGAETCVRLAKVFNYPPAEVLEMAEILKPTQPADKQTRRLLHLFDQLPDDKKEQVMQYVQFIGQQ